MQYFPPRDSRTRLDGPSGGRSQGSCPFLPRNLGLPSLRCTVDGVSYRRVDVILHGGTKEVPRRLVAVDRTPRVGALVELRRH